MKNRIVPLAATVAMVASVGIAAMPAAAGAYAIPSRDACPAQKNPHASERDKERALRCLIDGVRRSAGAGGLSSNRALERAAGHKARDLAECGFSHNACGRDASAWADHFGYDSASSWRWAENLASGRRGMTARATVKGWLRSGPHRDTMMEGAFEHIGVGLKRTGSRAYWVIEVGCRGC